MRIVETALASLALLAAGCGSQRTAGPRTITVAQSGSADVIGSDSAALQEAAGDRSRNLCHGQ